MFVDMPNPATPNARHTRLLRLPEVMARVGLCRASIYQYMTEGSFPKSIAIGVRSRGWIEYEIDAWIDMRIHARRDN